MEELTFRPLTDDDKRRICDWKYNGPYEIYNLPSCGKLKAEQKGFYNPHAERDYLGFWDGDLLIGYVRLREEDNEVFIGIGVNPQYCGMHYGRNILQMSYIISRERSGSKPLYLIVRAWNQRAIRCYQSAGFQVDGQPFPLTACGGTDLYLRMTKA